MSERVSLQGIGALRPVDLQAARLLARLYGAACPELFWATALTSAATGLGHSCLPLAQLADFVQTLGLAPALTTRVLTLCADPTTLAETLRRTGQVGGPGDCRPLILDVANRLYLRRLFQAERDIARRLQARLTAGQEMPELDLQAGRVLLDQLFAADQAAGDQQQKLAAALALRQSFLLIVGGPGTGKTYTVARILAALSAFATTPLALGLAAPTGKAALRLQESIQAARQSLPADLAAGLQVEAHTLHRLLGFNPATDHFRFHADNPLTLDLLVLDEASMVDLSLMDALLKALSPDCRLILLGDRDQLASVEAGNLLADLCPLAEPVWPTALCRELEALTGLPLVAGSGSVSPLDQARISLQTSRRFQENSSIAALARALRRGDAAACLTVLAAKQEDLQVQEEAKLSELVADFLGPVAQAAGPAEALTALAQRRILCALREGPEGVGGINRLGEELFRRRGLHLSGPEVICRCMPLMIVRNDYNLGLFNGDGGVFWPDDEGRLLAWFMQENGQLRGITPLRLPAWEKACAITVHKAQGSEFNEVALVLPRGDSPLLSRELLYTAITRARRRLVLYGERQRFAELSLRPLQRFSGLAAALAGEEK